MLRTKWTVHRCQEQESRRAHAAFSPSLIVGDDEANGVEATPSGRAQELEPERLRLHLAQVDPHARRSRKPSARELADHELLGWQGDRKRLCVAAGRQALDLLNSGRRS